MSFQLLQVYQTPAMLLVLLVLLVGYGRAG